MQVKQIANEITSMLELKNRNYGNSYDKIRTKRGPTSLLIRLEDKFSRLESIIENKPKDLGDESYEDTLKDIIGYCLLELNYLQKEDF